MSANRILTIPRNIECLSFPLKSSIGLKYTSVALSSSIICLGTNTGSTYVFEKESLKLKKFIANKGGSIEILQFSKDERLLAIVDSTGIVTCLEVNEEKYEFKVTKEIEDHKGANITSITWDGDSARLFIGDERGIVTAVIVAPFKLPAGKFLSKSTVEVIVKAEFPIVQLDYSKSKLLVSTTTRTLLCLTEKSKYQQVGSKPRDGKFGSCFVQYGEGEFPVIYAARPGSRLWEVDFHGQVLATHQFKYILATPPTKLCGFTQGCSLISDQTLDKPQSVAFPKLSPFCNRFIITWSSYGLYVLDASRGKVSGWYDQIKGVKDISCRNESIFVVTHDGEILELEYLTVKDCLKCLLGMSEYLQAAEVAVNSQDEILMHVESYLTIDFESVKEQLAESENSTALVDSLQDLIRQLQERHDQIRAEIQERLNGLPNIDESSTPCDSGVEDNDEVRSNQSEVISETSSRISLSRLSHVDVDRVLRRATNAVFNKIASSGFMKRALNDGTDDLKQPCPTGSLWKGSPQPSRASSGPASPQAEQVQNSSTVDISSAASFLQTTEGVENPTKEMGNVELKSLDPTQGDDFLTGKAPHGKRPVNGKRRKKAKIVTVDFESPEKDDIFKTTTYETSGKSHVRRLLSSDSATSYTQVSDIKRLGSLPYHVNKLDTMDNKVIPAEDKVIPIKDTIDSHPHFNHANIIEKAKQFVRKVIHTDLPAPLDVRNSGDVTTRSGDVTTRSFITRPDKLTCLLVSESAMKAIPKFVDVTAVCRNKLRDSRMLFNSKTVKRILQDWAEKLSDTVKDFSIAMANDIEKKNKKHKFTNGEADLLLMRTREEFFANLGAAFSEVSNLAVLCFEAGIFPTSCADLTLLEKRLIENEKTFSRIRKEVNDILNKDDSENDGNENKVPQESNPTTLLYLAQSCKNEGEYSRGDKDLDKGGNDTIQSLQNSEQEDNLNDNNLNNETQNKIDATEDSPKQLRAGQSDGSFDESVENKELQTVKCNDVERKLSDKQSEEIFRETSKESMSNSLLKTAKGNVSKQEKSSSSVLQESSIENVAKAGISSSKTSKKTSANQSHERNETLRSAHSAKTLNSSAIRYLQGKNGTKKGDKSDARSSSKENNSLDNRINRVPSSTLRDYVDVQVPKETCFLQENVEAILCTSDDPKTCLSCREDVCRACFVLRYFPLLDLGKIRTVLGWKKGCRWRTWLAYLIHLEDTTFSQELDQAIIGKNNEKISRLLHDSSNVEQLFSSVRRLLPSSSSLVFDLCTEKDVHPWEASFIYMINVTQMESLSNFLNYITTMRRIKPSTNPIEDASVAMTTLYCSLKFTSNSGNIKNFYCDCGAAREGAHLLPWKQKDFIDDVIDVMVSKDPYCGLVNRAFDLCRRYGYWHGCIGILRIRREHKQAFELISQLGDFSLIDEYVRTEAFSISPSDLKYLCSLIYHQRDDGTRCESAFPGFTPTINNESLARLLVSELGPRQALGILKCFKEDTFQLPNEFYFDCMKVAEKEIEQRKIVLKMVETLNNEVCLETKSMFQRQIEQMKNQELSDGFASPDSPIKDESEVSEDVRNSTSSNHWGVNLSLASSNCPCCTLPLCLHGASSSAGLIVFECGHTYHKHCLPEDACLLCYYKLNSFAF